MMVQSQNYSTQKYFVVWKTKYLSCACLLNHIFSFTVHHLQPRNFIHCDHRKLHLFHAQGLCIVCREHISRDRLLSTSTFDVKNSALSALSCLVITDVHMHSSNALMSTPCLLRGVFFFPLLPLFYSTESTYVSRASERFAKGIPSRRAVMRGDVWSWRIFFLLCFCAFRFPLNWQVFFLNLSYHHL